MNKYEQLRDHLRNEIISGKYKPGGKIPTEYELSAIYNVNPTTVNKSISQLVHEGLLHRIQGRGTFVNHGAGFGVLKRCEILIPKDAFHEHSFYFSVIKGIESKALEDNVEVFIHTYEEPTSSFSKSKTIHPAGTKDIALAVLSPFTTDEQISTLRNSGLPFVLVGHYLSDPEVCAVYYDTYDGAFEMTEYLIDTGHKSIVLVGGLYSTAPLSKDLFKGYREALAKHNISFRPEWVMESEWLIEEGYRLTKNLLKLSERPTAIFAGDDTIAVGVIKALTENSIKVPGEITVVGFNDLDLATIVKPNLTTIKVPRFEMGQEAYSILSKLAKHEEITPKQKVFKTELIVRET